MARRGRGERGSGSREGRDGANTSSRRSAGTGPEPGGARSRREARGEVRRGASRPSSPSAPANFQGGRFGLQQTSVIFAIALVVVGIIFLKLFYLQVIVAPEYSEMAENERTATIVEEARRGTIYDRNGNVLAIDIDTKTVFANPSELAGMEEYAASKVAEYLGGNASDYVKAIKESGSNTFAYIAKDADRDKVEALMEALEEKEDDDGNVVQVGVSGVYAVDDTKRVYPCGQTAGQVVGFCNDEGEGISGLEAYYDDILRGTEGKIVYERGEDGTPIVGRVQESVDPVDGQDIMVSIDIGLQAYVEARLLQDEEGLTANGGYAIVMDAATGEIYAAASLPLFNPADTANSEVGSDQLTCITRALEPGSVYKSVAALSVLDTGTMGTEDSIECPAYLEADGYYISDAESRGDTVYTLREIINYSSNVGISLATEKMGFEEFYNRILQFGLSDQTGVDYPGEAVGYLLDYSYWSRIQAYNATFGQGLSVTPLSMARFYGALRNGGVACTPHFLVSMLQTGEKVEWESETIIDNDDAVNDMVSMLKTVVTDGTATAAAIDGYAAAGKTSTAEVADEENGGYKADVYNVAFIGFIADSTSELVCAVGASSVPWTSVTTPVFRDIMSYAIDRYRITPL